MFFVCFCEFDLFDFVGFLGMLYKRLLLGCVFICILFFVWVWSGGGGVFGREWEYDKFKGNRICLFVEREKVLFFLVKSSYE